jgi:NADH dehydrogenase FAD-containing subunit
MTPADNRARIQRDDRLTLPARTRTFVIGDIAALIDGADAEIKRMEAKLQLEVNAWYLSKNQTRR